MSLLSIGCGEAYLEKELGNEFDLDLTLVDPVESYINKAKEITPNAKTHVMF